MLEFFRSGDYAEILSIRSVTRKSEIATKRHKMHEAARPQQMLEAKVGIHLRGMQRLRR
jgi:hypothetical protein